MNASLNDLNLNFINIFLTLFQLCINFYLIEISILYLHIQKKKDSGFNKQHLTREGFGLNLCCSHFFCVPGPEKVDVIRATSHVALSQQSLVEEGKVEMENFFQLPYIHKFVSVFFLLLAELWCFTMHFIVRQKLLVILKVFI